MEIRFQKDAEEIGDPDQQLSDFVKKMKRHQAEWVARLQNSPDDFAQIEPEVHQAFGEGGGRWLAALMVRCSEAATAGDDESPCNCGRRRELRTVGMQLLCGLMLWVTTWYVVPPRRKDQNKTRQLGGLFPQLAAMGFGKGCSPGLQYTVARIVALSPSIKVAQKELRRQGLKLDYKAVRRIAEQLGTQLLALRQRELLAWRAGQLPAGREFAGCRVSVQIDGGRIRMRHNKKHSGKRKKGERAKFKTPWREPKLLTIFVFDEKGKMLHKHRQPLIDGTLLGPDHLAELVAYHLHRLGVAEAEAVVFVADGAPWIWDRINWIVRRAGLDPAKVVEVLDFFHASHHISKALKALGLKGKARKKRYRELRRWLKEGRHAEIVSELRRLAEEKEIKNDETETAQQKGEVWTEIRYLEKHGSAGRLDYARFRERGLPLGSGAIESTIRRVINLRLKSNAMYWLEENAEAMFVLRGLLLSDRWDETLPRVRATMATDRSLEWHWEAAEIPKDLNALRKVAPPIAQPHDTKNLMAIVV